jgi:hypothetical protein
VGKWIDQIVGFTVKVALSEWWLVIYQNPKATMHAASSTASIVTSHQTLIKLHPEEFWVFPLEISACFVASAWI